MAISLNTKTTKHLIITFLIESLLVINLFFALFPAWRLSPLWNYMGEDGYFSVWFGILTKINLLIFVSILFLNHKIVSKTILLIIILLAILMLTSMTANNAASGFGTLIIFPFEYIVLFTIIPQYHLKSSLIKIAIIAMLLWAVIPIILMIIGPSHVQLALITGAKGEISTFGGLAYHRNFYGFYTGLVLLLVIVSPIRTFLKYSSIIACGIGLILSGSRSGIACFIVAIMWYLFITNKKRFIKLLPIVLTSGIIFFSLLSYFNIRDKGIDGNDDRYEIMNGFVSTIQDAPFLGQGKSTIYFSPSFPEGAPAHNFILQIWSDFGLITLLIFMLLLFLLYNRGNNVFKTALIYLICIGLTQPYFNLSIPNDMLIIICLIGNSSLYQIQKYNNRYTKIQFSNTPNL
ncbi:MAG: O-antigen ligase family protein [Bacteroidales bacterium]|nr:O-antigen ligase family protein [Bacteroidales bacterium]